jgi:hypothetical protein
MAGSATDCRSTGGSESHRLQSTNCFFASEFLVTARLRGSHLDEFAGDHNPAIPLAINRLPKCKNLLKEASHNLRFRSTIQKKT